MNTITESVANSGLYIYASNEFKKLVIANTRTHKYSDKWPEYSTKCREQMFSRSLLIRLQFSVDHF
jgi:hypothetical protein